MFNAWLGTSLGASLHLNSGRPLSTTDMSTNLLCFGVVRKMLDQICALDSEYEAEKPTEYLIDLGMHPQNSPVKHHSSLEEGSDDSFPCH